MSVVVSDTTPLHYLVLTESVDLLRKLFVSLVIPPEVIAEMRAENTPAKVKSWAEHLPAWAEVRACRLQPEQELGSGEESAIALAVEIGADFLLVDERKARKKAVAKGIEVIGTVGILLMAASQGPIDLDEHFERMRQTNAYVGDNVCDRARRLLRLLKERDGPSE